MKYYLILFISILLFSCKKEEKIEPVKIEKWEMEKPSYFPNPVYNFVNNEQTKGRFDLGRKLFYDPLLSIDGTVSCATCHSQGHAFAGHNVKISPGVNGLLGTRNSPSITNLAWYPSFMWDGGVNHIEVFSVAPITNPVEMNETMINVVAKINANSTYKELFKTNYGIENVTDQAILRALTQYMAMIVSADSKYDKYRKGTETLSAEESEGLLLFQTKCASCHQEPLFTNFSYKNNGLDTAFIDKGRGKITQNPNDDGKFRVPSLRNVMLTYPYMHDGRFHSIEDVLEHYNSGIKQSYTLNAELSNGIPLTENEKAKIITFLNTLTDYSLLNNYELGEH